MAANQPCSCWGSASSTLLRAQPRWSCGGAPVPRISTGLQPIAQSPQPTPCASVMGIICQMLTGPAWKHRRSCRPTAPSACASSSVFIFQAIHHSA
eukprot:scaffold248932_cov43-Prasinocladus_malaysianus.AAC.1